MPTLAQRINDLTTRIATEFKSVKTMLSGNNQGALTGLNTTNKSNLLAAINEVNTAQAAKIPASEKGAINGVATLNGSGQIPSSQLPAYVDDVLEFANLAAFPGVGETGKLYLAIDTNRSYRWGGSTYAQIGNSGAVDSVFGRTGNVIVQFGDYNTGQIQSSSSIGGPTLNDVLDTIHADAYGVSEIGNPDTDLVAAFNAALV